MSEKEIEAQPCPNQEKVDPRVRRTRKLLEDALRSLFREKPYGQISVGDITERATVNRATFYAHFEDKRHLASTMLRDDLHAALLARIVPHTPLSREALGEIAEAIFEFMAKLLSGCPKEADEFALTLLSTLQETIRYFIWHWFDCDPNAIDAFPGSTKEAATTMISWSLYGGAMHWISQHRRPPSGPAARQIVALLIR